MLPFNLICLPSTSLMWLLISVVRNQLEAFVVVAVVA